MSMDSGRKSLNELFTGDRFFYIPDYQRNYSWEDKQINDFFDDFKANFKGVNKRYYYGTILLQDISGESKEKYEIVDGQQRLTTLIVFLKCLIDRINRIEDKGNDIDDSDIDDLKRKYVIKKKNFILTCQKEDNDFFHTYILSDKPVDKNAIKTPSQKRLLHLKESFVELLKKMDDKDVLAFVDKINNTVILVYLVESRSEASLIFETTNDRGKQLTNIEKTKSYLMYKASLIDDSEQLLSTIQSRFNDIYQAYSAIEKRHISEDSILQYTFIAYEDWNNTKGQKEYQHYMEFMKHRADAYLDNDDFNGFIDYVENYTLNIKESFSTIKTIYENQCEEFKDLVALDVLSIFYPLLIKTYRMDTSSNKDSFKVVCRLLEMFVFRVYVIQRYSTTKFQTKWYELAKRFGGDFSKLNNSIIDLIKSEEVGSDDSFLNALADKNFYTIYSAADKNYFFWKYENYLRTHEQPISSKLPHEDLKREKGKKTNLTIEHIVAKKNANEQSKIIENDGIVTVGRADTFNREYLNSIGNLTIDPQSANSSKGKKDVKEKISKYFKKAPYKCQNELEDFLVDEKWKIKSHENRKNKLIKFAKAVWCTYDDYYDANVSKEVISDEEDDEAE